MTSLSRSSFKPLVIRSYKILRKMSSSSSSCLNVEVKNEETAAPRSEWPWKKAKKAAVMLSFCGKKYLGMQRNPGFPTVEEELMKALKATGSIAPEWFENAQKAFFQRASRTDKGVSAARMIVSLKMGKISSVEYFFPFCSIRFGTKDSGYNVTRTWWPLQ